MSRSSQIRPDSRRSPPHVPDLTALPAHVLVVVWLYVRCLRLCRRARYALGLSGRRWRRREAPSLFVQARVLE
jgi:hypothetical protein